MLARALKWLTLCLLALVLLYSAVLAYARLTTPTAAQREAIAVLEARMPAGTGEGVPLLHYARRLDVAEADLAAAYARDVAAARAGQDAQVQPDAASALPDLLLRCSGADCLALVRAEPAFADVIAAWEPVRDRVARALASDSLASRNEGAPAMMPAWQVLAVGESAHALAFARGDRAAAIDALCVDAGHLRRHVRVSSSSLIATMLYGGFFSRHAELLSAMLAESPDVPLPPSCAALMAPPDEPLSAPFCDAMAGELSFTREFQRVLDRERATQGAFDRAAFALLDDAQAREGFFAERLAGFCTLEAEAALRADDPAGFPVPAPRYRLVDRIGLWSVIEPVDIGEQAFAGYFQRAADHVAMQRLLAARLLLHGTDPAAPLAGRLAALPAWVHSPTRRIEATPEGDALVLPSMADDRPALRLALVPAAAP